MENSSNADVSQDSSSDIASLLSSFSDFSDSDTSEPSLLSALKPYLNEKRRKKVDQCENFIMLAGVIKMLNVFDFPKDKE